MSDYDGSSSDEEEIAAGFVKGRDAFIYVVDALMFRKTEHFQEAFTSIREAFLLGIISYPRELIGIVFHNTKNSPSPKDMTGMEDLVVLSNQCIFLPLKPLSKDIFCYFQEFCTNNYFNFESKYGLEEGSFQNTIRLCCSMFHNCRPKPGVQTIVYLTDQESPHPQGSDEYNKSMIKANDLKDINVDFEVIPMSKEFNYDLFYKEFLCLVRDQDIDSFVAEDTENKKEMFRTHQMAMNLKNKCISTLKWCLGDGVDLSIGYYNLFSKCRYPKPVKLLRSDNSLLTTKRVKELQALDEFGESSESGRLLLPGEEVQTLQYSGDFIAVSADEVAKLKTPIQPSLQLIGFIDNNSIPLEFFVKPTGFIYPNEKQIIGSTKLFTAIWQKCLDMEKAALCILTKKRKSYPSFVVLEPQKGSKGSFSGHDGFSVIYLPSFDNIRNVDVSEWKTEKPSNEQVSSFKSVIKKLRVNYDCKSKAFTDPSLDELNAKIIALAFDLETESIDSGLEPNVKEQDERIPLSKEDITRIFGEDEAKATKRAAVKPRNDGNIAKKVKTGEVDEQMIIEMVDRNALGALSVVQLKTYLQSKGETGVSKLTKPALIDKVMKLHS